MIICEFRRLTPGQPRPQQLFHLLGLLRGIFVHHPQLTCLKMLIITDVLDEKSHATQEIIAHPDSNGSDLYTA